MNRINRREFMKLLGASAALSATPTLLKAAPGSPAPRVVVAGGGFAGATLAKYLRLWSNGLIDVTVVDPRPAHVSCIMSNLVVNGRLGLDAITFDYATLNQKYGVNFVRDSVVDADPDGRWVRLAGGDTLPSDHVVLAPGISFANVPGLDFSKIPHAWIAGDQTLMLKEQLASIPEGGTFVMTIPPAPYRCPPGPYERACVVADYLKNRVPGNTKAIVLDANPDFVVEKHTFGNAFANLYGDIVEYHNNVELLEVDSDARVAITSQGDFRSDVLNVIPPHKAGKLIEDLGLATVGGRWASVDPLSYRSTVAPGLFVLGDAGGTSQPKSGHMANAQAKVCADALIRIFAGQSSSIASPERTANLTTNSACYSPISYDTASWLTAVFAYDPASGSMKLVPESFGEAPEVTRENYEDMFAWSQNLFADTFM